MLEEKNYVSLDLRYRILKELNAGSCTVTALARKMNRRSEYVTKQLTDLRTNNLVSFDNLSDDKRVRMYAPTSRGRMVLEMTNNFEAISYDLQELIEATESVILKDMLRRSYNIIVGRESWLCTEPIKFARLRTTFHDGPILKGIQELGVEVKQCDSNLTSDERLRRIRDKSVDITTVPSVTLLQKLSEQDIFNDLFIIGAIRNDFSARLVRSDENHAKVYYDDNSGWGRKKLAVVSDKDNSPVPVDHIELLKGAASLDFNAFVTNDPDPMLFHFEYGHHIGERFNDISLIMTHADMIESGNKFIKQLYSHDDNLLRRTSEKGWLMEEAITNLNTELIPYIANNQKVYPQLYRYLKSERASEVFAN